MVCTVAVANTFLMLSQEDSIPINIIKLIRLVCLANGWYYVIHSEPLFEEPIIAWKYGCTLVSVADAFGGRPGTANINQLHSISVFNKPQLTYTPLVKRESACFPLIKRVWDVYKDFTSAQLSYWDAHDNHPWSITRKKHPDINAQIDLSLYRDFLLTKDRHNVKVRQD